MKRRLPVLFLLLLIISSLQSQDLVFWSTQTNNTLNSLDITSGNTQTITPGQTLIRRLRVDQDLERLFWSAGGLNKIQKSNANPQGSNIFDVKTNVTNVATIAVDGIANKVYYHLANGRQILSCDTAGMNVTILINLGVPSTILGIEIDNFANHIYWTERNSLGNSIKRADLTTGLNQTTIYSTTESVFDIKIFPEDSSIYFTNRTGNKLQKIDYNGSNLQTLITEGANTIIGAISGDYCNDVIYYVLSRTGPFANRGSIKRTNTAGTNFTTVLDTSITLLNGIDVLYEFNLGRTKNFLGPDITACEDSLILNASVRGGSYLWNDNSTNPTLTVKQNGVYSVTVTAGNCSKVDSVQITLSSNFQVNLGNDTTICSADSFLIDAYTPNASYRWNDNSTDSTLLVKTSGQYFVDVTLNNCVKQDTIIVTFSNLQANYLSADTSICDSSLVLRPNVSANSSIIWNNNSTADTLLIQSSGIYWIEVTNGICTVRDSIMVDLGTGNLAPLFPNDTTLCDGDSIRFDFGSIPNQTFLWNDSTTIPTKTIKQSGLYWLEIFDNGCASRDTFNLSIKEQPVINLGPDTSVCNGALFGTSFSNPNSSYLWNTGSIDTSIIVNASGTYWLEVLLDGCIFRDSVTLAVDPSPSIDLGPDTTLCLGDTISLSQSSFTAQYLWNDSSTAPSIKVFETGDYWLDFTVDGCSTRDSIRVESFDSLGVSYLPKSASICDNEDLRFQLPLQNSNYLWQDGTTNRNYSIGDSGVYFVQISNTCATRTDSITVTKQCECEVIVPTAFTPNNDFINDQFISRISCELESYSLEIFNRWGEKIFQSSQQKQAWDGTKDGKNLKDGIYYYVLNYKALNESIKTIQGNVLLSR